jgi:hypothetical protein
MKMIVVSTSAVFDCLNEVGVQKKKNNSHKKPQGCCSHKKPQKLNRFSNKNHLDVVA